MLPSSYVLPRPLADILQSEHILQCPLADMPPSSHILQRPLEDMPPSKHVLQRPLGDMPRSEVRNRICRAYYLFWKFVVIHVSSPISNRIKHSVGRQSASSPICQRSCRKDTTKKFAIVSLRPFLSVFVSLRRKKIWKCQKKCVTLHHETISNDQDEKSLFVQALVKQNFIHNRLGQMYFFDFSSFTEKS